MTSHSDERARKPATPGKKAKAKKASTRAMRT
jgi:hypothetical protein